MAETGTNAEGASGNAGGDRQHRGKITRQKPSAVGKRKRAAGKNTSRKDAAGEAGDPAFGIVLSANELKTPLDMNGAPFENGQLVECQQCWKRMHAPQQSPYLRCFHCNSVMRPETSREEAARLPPTAKVSGNVQPGRASAKLGSGRAKTKSHPEKHKTKSPMPRTRQPLPKETFNRFETTFQEVKAAEVIHQLFL